MFSPDLDEPGAISSKGVAGVNNVAVFGETTQQVADTLDQRVELRLNEYFSH